MTGWLLIFVVQVWNGGGAAVAPFATKEACEQALVIMRQDKDMSGRIRSAVCVRQS